MLKRYAKKLFVLCFLLVNTGFSFAASKAVEVDFTNREHPERPTIAVVGGGVSGLLAAKKLLENNYSVVIFEKSDRLFGVWQSMANDYSKIQVDSYLYTPVGEPVIASQSATGQVFSSKDEVIAYFSSFVEKYHLRDYVQFNANVSSWNDLDNGLFEVNYTQEGVQKRTEVSGVWIRTGALSSPRRLEFPGEGNFEGPIAYGVQNDTADIDYRGKKVVIVGIGATAMENAVEAHRRGAESVTFVARHRKFVFPKNAYNEVAAQGLSLKANLLIVLVDRLGEESCNLQEKLMIKLVF